MRIAVLDTETTGIPSRHPHAAIVEVGAVIVDWCGDGLTMISTFDAIARPQPECYRVPEAAQALRLNGLTVEMIDAAPPDYLVGLELEAWLVAHDVRGVAAYNAAFDFDDVLLGSGRWMRRFLRRAAVLPCLMEAAQGKLRMSRWPRLDVACRLLGVDLDGSAHEALTDARAAAQLMPRVLDLEEVQRMVLAHEESVAQMLTRSSWEARGV